MLNLSLFEGELGRLAFFDADQDAEVVSRWTHNAEFMRLVDNEPARPLSAAQIKKRHEEMDKEAEKGSGPFWFGVHSRADDRLIGFAAIKWLEWSNGAAHLQLGIAAPEDRGRGYGREALAMVLRYAFAELNLHRLSVSTPAYNERGIRCLEQSGFALEVRRRQGVHQDGRRWDLLVYGILRPEWEARTKREA